MAEDTHKSAKGIRFATREEMQDVRGTVKERAASFAAAEEKPSASLGRRSIDALTGAAAGARCLLTSLDACMHTHTHAHTHARMHAHACSTHARTHARTHAHTHTRTHARMHARTRAHMHARTHAHARTSTLACARRQQHPQQPGGGQAAPVHPQAQDARQPTVLGPPGQ